MTDIAERTDKLRQRVKRRREEVQKYLDDRFYRSARGILKHAEALDTHGTFRQDPTGLPEYLSSVERPMYWTLIAKNLSSYRYGTPQEFMEDMRLVVDNCFAYNGDSTKFSALARSIEIDMEDAFVKELGEAPPSVAEMKALSKRLPPQASADILKVFHLYERKETKSTSAKAFISLAACSCATKRRILQLMREAVEKKESKAPPKSAPRKAPVSGGGGGIPVKRPHNPPSGGALPKIPGGPPAGAPLLAGGGFGDKGIVQAADDISFHNEEGAPAPPPTATTLERVPQNARTDEFTLRDISPARLDDSCSDDGENSDGENGDGDTTPNSSGFAPIESGLESPNDNEEAAAKPTPATATDSSPVAQAENKDDAVQRDPVHAAAPAPNAEQRAPAAEEEGSLQFNENA